MIRKTGSFAGLMPGHPIINGMKSMESMDLLTMESAAGLKKRKMIKHVKAITHVLKSLKMINKRTMELEFIDNVTVERGGVKEVYKVLDEFTAGQRLKKLLVLGEHTEISKEARFMMVEENNLRKSKIIAEAIVVHSFAQKLSANFYRMLLKNIYPIQFFTDREKAEKWLREC